MSGARTADPRRQSSETASQPPRRPTATGGARAISPELVALFGLLALHVVLAWVMRAPGITWGGDQSQYSALARELTSGSYRDRWLTDAPIHARYPPGLPALLAVANVLFGESFDIQIAVVIVCSAVSLLLMYDLVRRRVSPEAALFVTALCAINPMLLDHAGDVMSEAPFRLWLTVALWGVSASEPRTRDHVVAVAGAVMAALTRTAGLAVLAAVAALFIVQRHWRSVGGLLLASTPVVAWMAWTFLAPEPAARGLYHTDLVAGAAKAPDLDATVFVRRVARNLLNYGRWGLPSALSFFDIPRSVIDKLVWLGLILVSVPLGVLAAWRRWRALVFFLAFYAAVILVWPWRSPRFAGPASPLIFSLIGFGLTVLAARWSPRAQRLALLIVAAPFALGAWWSGRETLYDRLACDRGRVAYSPTCASLEQRGYLQLAEYARDSTDPRSVFYATKEADFYWLTRRHTIVERATDWVPPDSLGAYLRRMGVTYATVSKIGVGSQRHNRMVARICQELVLVQTFPGDASLLRMRTARDAAGDDSACRVTEPWHPRPAQP